MENTKTIGERSEAMVLATLLRLGRVVLMPFGDNQRYDMAIDVGDGKIIRGQCKTARREKGCLTFSCSSVNGFTGERRDYRGQCEVFWVYDPHGDSVYEVPVDLAGRSTCSLRTEPTRGGSKSNTRWASDHLIS